MTVSIVYRGNGAWGTGQGSDLSAAQVDTNFFDLATAVDALVAGSAGKQIAYITSSSGGLTVVYTDHSTDGPFPLPVAAFTWRGVWQPSTLYFLYDIVVFGSFIYLVTFQHTSALAFDPGANDGFGHNFYQPMLSVAPLAIPSQEITGTTYTPVLADANSYLWFSSPSGCTFTLPPPSSVAFVQDTEFHLRDETTSPGGGVIVAATAPATIIGVDTKLDQTAHKGSTVFLKLIDATSGIWHLGGGLASA